MRARLSSVEQSVAYEFDAARNEKSQLQMLLNDTTARLNNKIASLES